VNKQELVRRLERYGITMSNNTLGTGIMLYEDCLVFTQHDFTYSLAYEDIIATGFYCNVLTLQGKRFTYQI